MKKSNTKAKLTVSEFQTWLQGIMEFQDSDWSPNKEQWVAIYNKIMNLKEAEGTVRVSAASVREIVDGVEEILPNFNEPPTVVQQPRQPLIEEPVNNALVQENVGGGVSPEPVEIISQEELVTLSEEEIRQKIEQAKKFGGSSVNNPIKTPDIDTSNGNYKSGFV